MHISYPQKIEKDMQLMMETIKSLSLTITDMEEIKKKKKIAWNTCIGSLCCFAVFFFFF